MRSNTQTGFTLIELMVTVAVAVVLAFLAVPTFSDLIIKSRLRGATDDIVSLLNSSRANSVKLQRQINVSLQGTTAWCAGAIAESGPASVGAAATVSTTACDCINSPSACTVNSDSMLVSSSSYSGVALSSLQGSFDYASGGVTFDQKFGGLSPSTLLVGTFTTPKVTVTSGKYSTQISVSPLGQTNVCVPSGSPFVSGYPSC